MIPTFWALHLFGFSMNTLTMLALSLVVGMLVDDAIVEVENNVRHLRMGKPPLQAATDAAIEIGLAVVATSLTLCAVFVPVAFMDGIPGEFFKALRLHRHGGGAVLAAGGAHADTDDGLAPDEAPYGGRPSGAASRTGTWAG